jgi:hypothetical protein
MITKDHAAKIAAKLHATFRQGGNHDIAIIEYEGQRIAQFGIRRGSRRDAGHDHIPASIYVSVRSALDLARCPMSYEQWIDVLREKGLIERPRADDIVS